MARKKEHEKKEGRTFYGYAATGTMAGQEEMVRMGWGWGLALGIIMILLGIVAILFPIFTSIGIVFLLGTVLIVAGIVQIIHAFSWRGWGALVWHILVGLVYGIIGILLLVYPISGLVTLITLLTIYFLVSGVLRIILSVSTRYSHSWGWMLFSGIVSIILGIVLIAGFPIASLMLIGLFVGIDLVVNGFALAYRSATAQA